MNKTIVRLFLAAAAAALITVIMRIAVFVDDCNLLVVGMTFLLFFTLAYGIIIIAQKVKNRSSIMKKRPN